MKLLLPTMAIVGAGGFYLGYRLIVMGLTGGFKFTNNLDGWRLAFATVGPGAFVVLCGTSICLFAIRSLLTQTKSENTRPRISNHLSQREVSETPLIAKGINRSPLSLGFGQFFRGGKTLWPLGFAMSFLLIFLLVKTTSFNKGVASAQQEAHQTAELIRTRTSAISLEESHLIFDNVDPPVAQFMLSINPTNSNHEDAIYLFEECEYVIETGGDETKIPTAKLCDLVDAVYNRESPILESLRQVELEGQVVFPIWKSLSGEVTVRNLTPILVEILYSIRKFYETKTLRPEILIRGYADGQIADWERSLLTPPYNYSSIKLYPAKDRDSKNPVRFLKGEAQVTIPTKFKNRNLPNLRGHFVKTELVDPYLQVCRKYKNASSHVLEGYEFRETNRPLERKAQVFIFLFEKSSP